MEGGRGATSITQNGKDIFNVFLLHVWEVGGKPLRVQQWGYRVSIGRSRCKASVGLMFPSLLITAVLSPQLTV